MKLYLLYTAYPYEGGFIHGVFTTYEKAEQARMGEGFEWGHEDSYIREMTLDELVFNKIEI